MQKLLTRILVPVNFNQNTLWLMDKAVQLANKFDCDLVLLHVQPPSHIPSFWNDLFLWPVNPEPEEIGSKMHDLELQFGTRLNDGLQIHSLIRTGFWQPLLKEVIITEHVDLMILSQPLKKMRSAVIRHININKLSQQTNCPIMTVTRKFDVNELRNIVVPVFDLLPLKKLTLATYLTLETHGCIYLIGKDYSDPGNGEKRYLMKAYQLLNDFSNLKISCSLQSNTETGDSTLAYARNINANLIVVNPGKESRLKGLWNKLKGKYLSRESDIPVLTVAF